MEAVQTNLFPIGLADGVSGTLMQDVSTKHIDENGDRKFIEEQEHQAPLFSTNTNPHTYEIIENINNTKLRDEPVSRVSSELQCIILNQISNKVGKISDLNHHSSEKVSESLATVEGNANGSNSGSDAKETSLKVDISSDEDRKDELNVFTTCSPDGPVTLGILDEQTSSSVCDKPTDIIGPKPNNIEATVRVWGTKVGSSDAKLKEIIEMALQPEKTQNTDVRLQVIEFPQPPSGSVGTQNSILQCNVTASSSTNSKFADEELPNYLKALLEAMHVCGDSYAPLEDKPEWFDMHKFSRGQFIAMKYFFGLVFAEMISLYMILSHPAGLTPLVFTAKSDTPFKSFKRYLSTVTRVRSWYLDDIWKTDTEGHKNLKAVKAMHEAVRQKLHATSSEELAVKLTVAGNSSTICSEAALWSPLNTEIRNDFQASCVYPGPNQCPFIGFSNNRVFVNQMDMAIAQFGFVGLFVLFPERLGAHGVSDEDMECFVHLWRCLGYALGIEDRYNFCSGSLDTVRQRSRDVIHFWVKPNLREVSRDWEHMTRCIVEGISYYVPGVTFEVSLLYLCDILGIHAPRLSSALSFTQRILYYTTYFTLRVLLRIPGVLSFHNWLLRCAIKRAQVAPPDFLRELERRRYQYEEQVSCTRL